MTATRSQILCGVAEYIQRDVIPSITDVPLKLVLGTLAYQMRNVPDTFNARIFDNPAVKMLLVESGDSIDVDASLNGVVSSLQQYGGLTLTIPSIPLISKMEHTMTFNAQDIDRIKQYIGGAY